MFWFNLYSMFEDMLSIKYPGMSEKELSTKRSEEYHVWVKEYVCSFTFINVYMNAFIYTY